MKRLIYLGGISFLLTLLSGCEGYRCATGIIKDKQTDLLLDSVRIDVLSGSASMFSDSSGKFDVCNNFGGCVPECKDILVEFSKNGYKTKQEKNPSPGSIIYLEKQ